MRLTVVLIAVISILGSAEPTSASEKMRLAIIFPTNGSAVPMLTDVSGTVSDPSAEVWVIVQPLSYPSCWAQPRPYVEPLDGTESAKWSGRMYVGDDLTPSGLEFKVVAIANPKQKLSDGQVACWPAAEVASPSLTVKRR